MEMNSLAFLIYSSFATNRLSQRDLLELLTNARATNEAHGLTGMLLYRDGIYLQFLEGQRPDIDELLSRLEKDTRHHGIRIIQEGELAKRMFPDWSMAYKNLAGLRSANIPGYSEALQAQTIRARGTRMALQESPPRDPERLLIETFEGLLIHTR
jgi:hypothetical protein